MTRRKRLTDLQVAALKPKAASAKLFPIPIWQGTTSGSRSPARNPTPSPSVIQRNRSSQRTRAKSITAPSGIRSGLLTC